MPCQWKAPPPGLSDSVRSQELLVVSTPSSRVLARQIWSTARCRQGPPAEKKETVQTQATRPTDGGTGRGGGDHWVFSGPQHQLPADGIAPGTVIAGIGIVERTRRFQFQPRLVAVDQTDTAPGRT